MTSSTYSRRAAVIGLISVAAAVAAFLVGDHIYRQGVTPYSEVRQFVGWSIGCFGIGLPWVALRTYSLWLRGERGRGNAPAAVSWLKVLVRTIGVVWVAVLLLSLMVSRSPKGSALILALGGLIATLPTVVAAIFRRNGDGGGAA
jgi:hypothetical protein